MPTTTVATPLPSIGKMATVDCDDVNMDPDMEFLSDEELERYGNAMLLAIKMQPTV